MVQIKKYLLLLVLLLMSINSDGRTYYFMSYHLYTNENNKHDDSGAMPVPAIVEIMEETKQIILRLFDEGKETKGWYSFSFDIIEKMDLDNSIIVYIVTNNVTDKGYLYLSPRNKDGLYIDINYFYYNNAHICCWMQKPYKIKN